MRHRLPDPAPAAGVPAPLSPTPIPATAPGEGMTWDASNGLRHMGDLQGVREWEIRSEAGWHFSRNCCLWFAESRLSKNPKRGCWNWKLPSGFSWLTRDSTGSAGLSVPIASGAGGEIQDNSGKIPRDESTLQRAQLARAEEQEVVQISWSQWLVLCLSPQCSPSI